jgi:predicted DNA-binding transcriptional regulator AlpA
MPEYMTTAEVSDLTRLPQETLRYYRHLGDKGPRSFKLGGRRVVYDRADVLAWIEEQQAGASDVA